MRQATYQPVVCWPGAPVKCKNTRLHDTHGKPSEISFSEGFEDGMNLVFIWNFFQN